MYNPLIFDPVDLFDAQTLTVSGGATPAATSSRTCTERLTKVNVTVKNTGASTNVTVSIYAVNESTGGISYVIRPFTLGAGNVTAYTAGCYIEKDAIPRYLYAVATNSDAANTAIITVTIDRWR